MEVKNELVSCQQGHYYNAAIHAVCPICGSPAAGASSPIPKTGPAEGAQGAFPKTEAVGSGASSGNFVKTEAVIQRDIPSSSVQMPGHTIIGGDDGMLEETATEPVVGWLVCIEGPVRGTDYRIHAGYNYIGRDEGDIHIRGDQQISRQNHAMIAYDSDERVFYVGPSAGRNLIKVGGKTVISAVEIKAYDVLSIGTTKLLFVPLCGEHFSWGEGLRHA